MSDVLGDFRVTRRGGDLGGALKKEGSYGGNKEKGGESGNLI